MPSLSSIVKAFNRIMKAARIIEGQETALPPETGTKTVNFQKPESWDKLGFRTAPSPQFWLDFCRELGHDPTVKFHHLGDGEKGVAYQLSNGLVAKITKDEREAGTALYLMERQKQSDEMRHVFYNIYNVFPIKIGMLTRYCIVTEFLKKFEGTDRESWLKFASRWQRYVNIKRGAVEEGTTQDTKVTSPGSPKASKKQKEEPPKLKSNGKVPNLLPHNVKEFLTWLERRGTPAAQEEALWITDVANLLGGGSKSQRIEFADLHSGNIMWRPSTQSPVMIDLGGSNSPPASKAMPRAISKLLLASLKLSFR